MDAMATASGATGATGADLCATFWTRLNADPKADFLVTPSGRISYGELVQGIARWIAAFDAAGLAAGDRVLIRTGREDAACAGFVAALLDGLVPVMLEGVSPDARAAALAGTVEAKLIVADAAPAGAPAPVQLLTGDAKGKAGLKGLFARRPAPGFGLPDHAPAARPPRLPDEDGLAYLLFTSGTTAAPTGVRLSRGNLAANLSTIARLFDYGPESRIFNDMILAHADGLVQGPLLALWTGGALLRAGGFEVQKLEDWLGEVRRMRATHVLAVPTIWAMIDRYAAHDDYFDAPECRLLTTVAAKIPLELWERIETRFQRPLFNHYGLTETVASALYAGPHPEMGPKGGIGLPVDCEARIAGGGEEGELELRGPNVFDGYWRNPERDARSFTEDGWFRTGDLVRRNPDGAHEALGRLKSVIMTAGFLIRPDEIDEALSRHPGVVECATLGFDDPVFGEIAVTAAVAEGGGETAPDETDLTEHLRALLEPRKIPKRIVLVDTIPRGPSGKTRQDALRAALQAALAGGGDAGGGADAALEEAVLATAAKVFRVPVERLSLRTSPEELEAWDSFTQLNLVLAIEDRFARTLPASRVSGLRRLGDFVDILADPA